MEHWSFAWGAPTSRLMARRRHFARCWNFFPWKWQPVNHLVFSLSLGRCCCMNGFHQGLKEEVWARLKNFHAVTLVVANPSYINTTCWDIRQKNMADFPPKAKPGYTHCLCCQVKTPCPPPQEKIKPKLKQQQTFRTMLWDMAEK